MVELAAAMLRYVYVSAVIVLVGLFVQNALRARNRR